MISILADIQNLPGKVAEQPDFTESALSRGPEKMTCRQPYQFKLLYDFRTESHKSSRSLF